VFRQREAPSWGKTHERTQENRPLVSSRPSLQFSKGEVVEHKSFGRGIITNVNPGGGDALLEIAFEEAGTKRLMQNSAARYLSKIEI